MDGHTAASCPEYMVLLYHILMKKDIAYEERILSQARGGPWLWDIKLFCGFGILLKGQRKKFAASPHT